MTTTYALEQWRNLAAKGFRYTGDGCMVQGALSYFVPPAERALAFAASVAAERGDLRPDVECRECGHEFLSGHLGACRACGSRYLQRIQP